MEFNKLSVEDPVVLTVEKIREGFSKNLVDSEVLNSLIDDLMVLSKERNVRITYTDNQGTIRHLYLNIFSVRNIRDIVIHSSVHSDYERIPGISEYHQDFIMSPVGELEFHSFVRVTSSTGKGFGYLNTSHFDLTRYQIYSMDDEVDTEHCLSYSLRLLGFNVHALDIGTSYYPSEKLGEVARFLGVCIHLKSYEKDGQFYKTAGIHTSKFNLKSKNVITLAIVENHYFVYEKTENVMEGIRGNLTSLRLVIELYNMGMFMPYTQPEPKFVPPDSLESPEGISDLQQPFKGLKPKTPKRMWIAFGDIECITNFPGRNGNTCHHPFLYARYLVGQYDIADKATLVTPETNYRVFQESTEEWKGLHAFFSSFPPGKILLFFHNLKYDWNVIKDFPYIFVQNVLRKGSIYYKVTFTYGKGKNLRFFELRDSYKFIARKLSDMVDMFDLKIQGKHEYIMYDLYTKDNVMCDRDYVSVKDYEGESTEYVYHLSETGVKSSTEVDPDRMYILLDGRVLIDVAFRDRFPQYFSYGRYYHITHYKYYLHQDCFILRDGMMSFRENMLKAIDMDCFTELTISSLVHRKAVNMGCYSGCYEVRGRLREYIHAAAHGGRTCARDNKVIRCEGTIHALDGVSLYPSAIKRCCEDNGGFAMGPCKTITDWKERDKYFYYVARIRLTKINKYQQIPFVSYRVEKKATSSEKYKREYINEHVDSPMIVDKYTLEDWVKYQEIEYEFLDGFYWDEGGNTTLLELVETLFEARKNTKSRGLNEVYKLCLNSLFGKTMINVPDTKIVIKKNEDVPRYISKNFERILEQEDGPKYTYFTVISDTCQHSNLAHVACKILSNSKAIMNEVMDVANENKIYVLYQDTDSMHVVDSLSSDTSYYGKLDELVNLYKQKYNKDLIGDNLGQFHTDFKFPGHSNVYSNLSIVLGKKAYLDRLCGTPDDQNCKEDEHMLHVRMKGVNNAAMSEYKDYLVLYESMFSGDSVKFDLTYNNAPMFQFKGQVSSRKEYIKNISFKGERVIM